MVVKGEEEDLSASSGSSVMPNIFPEESSATVACHESVKLSELRLKLSNLIKNCAQEATLAELEDLIDYVERRRHISSTRGCLECGVASQSFCPTSESASLSKQSRKAAYPLSSPTVKRPRGRPKKEVTTLNDEQPSPTSTICSEDRQGQQLLPIIKRSRGRPRKYPRKEPPAVRRGPGRPRKTVLTGGNTSGGAVVGRPRKLSQSFPRDGGGGDVDLASDCSHGDESTEQSVSSITNSVSPHSPKFDERFASSVDTMPINHLTNDRPPSAMKDEVEAPPVVGAITGKLFETDEDESSSPNQLANRRAYAAILPREENVAMRQQPINGGVGRCGSPLNVVVGAGRVRPSVTDLMLQSPAIDHEVRSSIPLHVVNAIPPPPLLLQKPPSGIKTPPVVLKAEDTARSMLEAFGLKDEDLNLVTALRAFEMEMSRRNQPTTPQPTAG